MRGRGSPCPAGRARTQPRGGSAASSSRELTGSRFGGLCVQFLAIATAPALPAKEGAARQRHLLKVFILNLSFGDIFRCQFTPVFPWLCDRWPFIPA